MGRFGMGELLVVLLILVLMFGATKLPAIATGMGKAIKNFKRGIDTDDEIDVTPATKQVSEQSTASTVTEAEVVETEAAQHKS